MPESWHKRLDFGCAISKLLSDSSTKMQMPNKVLANGICSLRTLYNLKLGLNTSYDIGILQQIFERLGIPIERAIKHALDSINTNISATLILYSYLDDCDFYSASKFLSMPVSQDCPKKDKRLYDYFYCSKLLSNESYLSVIDYISDLNKQYDTPYIIDILIENCYWIAFFHINKANLELLDSMLLNVKFFEQAAINFLPYYPEIIIRIIVNIADLYRILGYIDKCKELLAIAEQQCYQTRLFDAIVDINLCKLIISIQFEEGVDMDKILIDIEANLNTIKKPHREKVIREKINVLIEYYQRNIVKLK